MDPKVKTLWDQIREYRKINAMITSMDKELGVYDESSRETSDLTMEAIQLYMTKLWPELLNPDGISVKGGSHDGQLT